MENRGNKKFGFFGGQLEVQDKIKELRKEGYPSDSLYVIAKNEEQVKALRLYSGVQFSTEQEGGWIDKFKDMFSGGHSLVNVFEEMGFTREEAEDYNRRIDNGEIFLYADDEVISENDRAVDHGAAAGHPGSGEGFDQQKMSRTERRKMQTGTEEESLLLHEEQLAVNKERVQTGEVNVNKRVVEEEQHMDVPVERDEVFVERRPVADPGTSNEQIRKEPYHIGDELHIPVVEERLVVTKKEVVVEEIVVTKKKIRETERITETVKREEVDIDDSSLPRGGRP